MSILFETLFKNNFFTIFLSRSIEQQIIDNLLNKSSFLHTNIYIYFNLYNLSDSLRMSHK